MKKDSSEGPLGLISSVSFESRTVLAKISARRLSRGICRGRIGGRTVFHVQGGIGIANAAHAATVLVERFAPGLVIVFGIGGSYPGSGARKGDVVIASEEVYADAGVAASRGFLGLEAIGIPLLKKGRRKYFNRFGFDGKLVGKAVEASGYDLKAGIFLTVSQVTGTRKRAVELRGRYGALCENMEGAAVAQVCAIYGVKMLELRGISNEAGDREAGNWRVDLASENCQGAVLNILGALGA